MSRYGVFILAWSLLLAIGLQSSSTHAFASNFQRPGVVAASLSSSSRTQNPRKEAAGASRTVIFSTPPESEGGDQLDPFSDPLSSNKPPASTSTPEDTSYPINLPSPILLGSSMILAIIGVGKQEEERILRF